MNDAERTPSPKRFCKKLGMRSAARKASATSELPKKWANTRSRTSPAILLRKIPAATIEAAARLAEGCGFGESDNQRPWRSRVARSGRAILQGGAARI